MALSLVGAVGVLMLSALQFMDTFGDKWFLMVCVFIVTGFVVSFWAQRYIITKETK
jgi:hypothetical protein